MYDFDILKLDRVVSIDTTSKMKILGNSTVCYLSFGITISDKFRINGFFCFVGDGGV